MGSMTVILTIFAVTLMIIGSEASGSCPLPSKVYSCSPKCVQDYECTHGKVCCTNGCNAKSCVEPAPYGGAGGNGGSNKHASGGNGIYCDNVRCSTGEVCKQDRNTKRSKCTRA